MARPLYIAGRNLSIKKPEDFDRIRGLGTPENFLVLIFFAVSFQADIQKRYSHHYANLDNQLDTEITHLVRQVQTAAVSQTEQQLIAVRQLIVLKGNALREATTKIKLFSVRDPVNQNAMIVNGQEFAKHLQRAVHRRKKPSAVYLSFSDAVTALHERKLLAQSLNRLEKKAASLSAAIAAERAQAEAVRKANTYHASGQLAATGAAFITAAGNVASSTVDFSLRAAISSAIGALAGFTSAVASGFLVGVSALIYSPRLGNGELPQRYALNTPLSDLAPALDRELKAGTTATTVSLPYRISSRAGVGGQSEVFVVKTDGKVVPSQVRVIAATYDPQRKVYSATTADVPPRTLTWTPAVVPGNASTTLPAEQTEAPVYTGATLAPLEIRIDSFPGVPDASFDDYVIVFPADAGLPPIYTMFRDRREDPGVGSGQGLKVDGSWSTSAAVGAGAPIPKQIADHLRGKSFTNWRNYRETFWRAVGNDDVLSQQFNPINIARMKNGFSPFAPGNEHAGARKAYELHHHHPIAEGGEVYNAENLRITTPRLHIEIHTREKK